MADLNASTPLLNNSIDGSELSLSQLPNENEASSKMTTKPHKHSAQQDDINTNKMSLSQQLIRSLSPVRIDNAALEQHNHLMDVNMNVPRAKSALSVNTAISDEESQFYETTGGGKIYMDPSYIPRNFRNNDDDDEDDVDADTLEDLRKNTSNLNKIHLQMDPSWTPFERYKCDLCFILLSIIMDLIAIVCTWIIFIVKDDLGNASFGADVGDHDDTHITNPYPTGYEILRCLFIPLFVYFVNRILHFVMSKSVHYLYKHGEKTLFITLRSIEDCNRHFVDICMVLIFGAYIYIICNYWYDLHHQAGEIVYDHSGFDKFINEDIWFRHQYVDTKIITYFMLIIFMVIYVFDIYCSLHYAYIYIRFDNYARYNGMRRQKNGFFGSRQNLKSKQKRPKVTNMNLQNNTMTVAITSDNLKGDGRDEDDKTKKRKRNKKKQQMQQEGADVIHIDLQKSGHTMNTDPTVSIMTLDDIPNINDCYFADYNPHQHPDIVAMKVDKDNPSNSEKQKNSTTKQNSKKIRKQKENSNVNPHEDQKQRIRVNTHSNDNKEDEEKRDILPGLFNTPPAMSKAVTSASVADYCSRHYSLFADNRVYKQSIDEEAVEESKSKMNLREFSRSRKTRQRSRSESELTNAYTSVLQNANNYGFDDRVRAARINSIHSEAVSDAPSPTWNSSIAKHKKVSIKPWNESNDDAKDKETDKDNKTMTIMELREKVNFLKAALFAKQSILDQFKLDLNEQTFIISNLSMKVQRIESEKQELEKELMDKNDQLEDKKILLQVAEETERQITNECNRLREKLKQTMSSKSKRKKHNGGNIERSATSVESASRSVVLSPGSRRKKHNK